MFFQQIIIPWYIVLVSKNEKEYLTRDIVCVHV